MTITVKSYQENFCLKSIIKHIEITLGRRRQTTGVISKVRPAAVVEKLPRSFEIGVGGYHRALL